LLSSIGLLGFDQFEKDGQPLFGRQRTVIVGIRLISFGKGMKYAGGLFHAASVSQCAAGDTEMFQWWGIDDSSQRI